MTVHRSEELLLDEAAVARALKAPKAPQFSSGLRTKYRLEDRLPGAGTLGSVMPPTERQLEAMRPTFPPTQKSAARPVLLGVALALLTAVTGAVVYRDMHREPATAPAVVGE